jgi:hypothetical protein
MALKMSQQVVVYYYLVLKLIFVVFLKKLQVAWGVRDDMIGELFEIWYRTL